MPRNGRKRIRTSTRRVIYKRDGGRCGICGHYVSMSKSTIDHIIPVGKGGGEKDKDNMQLAHYQCNQLKDDAGPEFKVVRTASGWYNASMEKYEKCKECKGWMTWSYEYSVVDKELAEDGSLPGKKGPLVYVGQYCPKGCKV